jgi:protein-L-isoaspartate O-methyltransferase
MTISSTSQRFFEQKYQAESDPWQFATSDYERGRYAAILRALQPRRYRHAFEPGCSIGVLTHQLASICDKVDAMDISPTAVKKARLRCGTSPNVSLVCGSLPQDLPEGPFDLIVFSEIGYYFDGSTLRVLLDEIVFRLESGGILLAVHWLGHSSDHILGGDHVHEILSDVGLLKHDYSERQECFRLDRWVRE